VKTLFWEASAKKDLLKMPDQVVDLVGYALYLAQCGLKHPKPSRSRGLVQPEYWRWWKMMTGIPSVLCIPSDSVTESMFCTASRRNHERVLRRRNKTWI